MASASQSLPPFEGNEPAAKRVEFSLELARLRDRFSMLEQIDAQPSILLARMAEARAAAGLEIATSITRIERLIAEQDARQHTLMTGVLSDLAAAHARATGLAQVAAELEESFAGLQARVQPVEPEDGAEIPEEPVAPLRIVPPVAEELRTPLPLSTLFIEIEGVPSVTVALSLQRFIAGLPGVVSALTREYAADIARFETQTTNRITGLDVQRESQGGLRLIEGYGDALRFVLFDPGAIAAPI